MTSLNKQIILRQALSGKQITINITNSNFIDIIKEEISKINNTNVYNLIINKKIYLCFELEKIKYDDIAEIAEGYHAREMQIIDIVFLSYKLVDIINILGKYVYYHNEKNYIYNLDNVNLIIYLIIKNLLIFKYVNSDIKNNFEIVKLAIQTHPYALQYASDELRLKKAKLFQT